MLKTLFAAPTTGAGGIRYPKETTSAPSGRAGRATSGQWAPATPSFTGTAAPGRTFRAARRVLFAPPGGAGRATFGRLATVARSCTGTAVPGRAFRAARRL